MVKILGREITIGQKKNDENQEAIRYNYSETVVKPALEKIGALKMVFDQAGLRDSTNFELDSVELRIQNQLDKISKIITVNKDGEINDADYKKLTDEEKENIALINKKIEILFMYRSLLFRCAYIGAYNNPQLQKKLAALHSILERKIDLPGYLPRLRVLINHVWSVSWRIIEGRTPPPIIIETPQTFPLKQGGGQDLKGLGSPDKKDKEPEEY